MIYIRGKIPLRIYPYFWLLAILIGWLNSFSEVSSFNLSIIKTVIWVLVITISVVIHEFGHALTALFFGQSAQIDLVAFGGLTHRQGPKLKLWKEFIIVLNGPLFGLIFASVIYFIFVKLQAKASFFPQYALQVALYVNIFWTAINLLPIQPLDGGKLLSIVLEGMFGITGVKVAYFLSILFAAMVGVFFFSLQAIIAGSLFFILAFESYRSFQEVKIVKKQDSNQEMQDLLKKAEEKIQNNQKEEAIADLYNLIDQTKSGVLHTKASQYLSFLLDDKGAFKEAYALLKPIKKKLDMSYLPFLQKLSFQNDDLNESIAIGNQLFSEHPSYDVAFINALCYAKKKEIKPCIGWLESAIRAGMPNPKIMISKQEFDEIREDCLFKNFVKKYIS